MTNDKEQERRERLEDMHDAMWSARQGWDTPFDRNAPWGLFEWVVFGGAFYFMIKTIFTHGIF
jgi:hypothetical protein